MGHATPVSSVRNSCILFIAVSILSFFTTFLHAQPPCGGTERWGQKVLVDTAANSINFTPDTITVNQFDSLPSYPPNSNAPRTAPLEFKTYAIHGRLEAKRNETDNDYHIILWDGGNLTCICEIPDPVCAGAATSHWVSDFIQARNWSDTHIGLATNNGVSFQSRVIITGVGFVDPPHGQSGVAPNNMELHPVLHLDWENPLSGINDATEYVHVTVGPNPFSVSTEIQLNTKLNNLGKVTITLFDILGEELQTTAVPTIGNSQIDYILEKNDLKAGVYLYRLRNNGDILYEGRLVVQ